ncbi:MAG: hypothetical protein WA061_03740 [Microgenomates group bacterium]
MARKLAGFVGIVFFTLFFVASVLAADTPAVPPAAPLPCSIDPRLGNCPKDLPDIYKKSAFYKGEKCVATYDEFVKNPLINHYWALDEQTTTQGKANERARQFLYWVMTKSAIDQHPAIRQIWTVTQNITLFLFLLVAALFGIGYIVGQRSDFQIKMQVWPIVYKIGAGLLYIIFSYAIIMTFVQLSEIIMKFFIESLGGDRLFNIYFTGAQSKEDSYATFVGCRDLNFKVQEAISAEMFLMKVTNVTYYLMGIMMLLRKILLWFLLFAAPFLALLMPFVFIRNVGWIWIGVFAQWVFYGPLFALFLGALTKIWQSGIPFPFDFSRATQVSGYIYPTGINIVYGGPAQIGSQIIGALNNGNYVDTFVEYVISLIMLWAVIWFPWWLLRIFRDYCCDGIMAMKNVLMSMYDRMAPPPPKTPPPAPTASHSFNNTSMKSTRDIETQMHIKMETLQEIKQTKTEDITKSLNLSMNKITDIAKFETNKQTNETVRKNIDMLSQPTKANTPAERQKFMNIRTELFNRTIKDDKVARQILSSISSSRTEINSRKEEILKTVPRSVTAPQAVAYKVNISNDKVTSMNTTLMNTVSSNTSIMENITKVTQAPAQQIQTVLSSYKVNIAKAPAQILTNITKETGIATDTVKSIIKAIAESVKKNKEVVKKVAEKEQMKEEDVERVIETQTPLVSEPEKTIEQTVAIPPSVSIEDYEEVKKMWTQQYEKGEVPASENITSREQWVDQDIVFITNTLNKLLSADDKLRQEGIDDLAYILPIFLINSLKGEELIVYLKAKIEAAKFVKHDMDKEREITEKLKKKSEETEEFVDVKKKTEENTKTLEMSQDLPGEEEKSKQEPTPLENESTPQPLPPKL